MSALAARRAAQAAKAAIRPVEETAGPALKKQPSPPPPSPTPSLSSMSTSDAEVEVEAPAPKRRKVDKRRSAREKREPRQKKPKARFFDPPAEEEEEAEAKAKRSRRYSPGAPQDSDESSADDGDDASSDDEDVLFDGTATPYSGAPSPRAMDPGPSRQLRPCSSSFEPEEGVNVLRLKDGAVMGLQGPSVLLSLGGAESLALVGTFAVIPLQHSLSLLSTTLHPADDALEAYPVFAPTCHPVPVLTGAVDSHVLRRSEALDQIKLPRTFRSDQSRALFLVQENLTGLEAIKGDMVPGFSNIWHDAARGAWGLQGVRTVLSTFSTPVYPHVTPASWTHALASLDGDHADASDDDDTPPPPDRVPSVLVKGAKRSGKSSLARAALNRLLETYERVAWLECDLGQGEFGCGGAVGLWLVDQPVLGPPFTHPRVPARAVYLGELSPQPCPDAYIAAVHAVLAHYTYEVQYPLASLQSVGAAKRVDAVPLVVNTQGWTKGLGEELMRAIEVAAEPTHIFAFEQQEEPTVVAPGWTNSPVQQATALPYASAALGASQSSTPPATIFTVEPAPQCPLQARYTAADMRTLSTVSYMHARLGEARWDFSLPLLAVRPWVVNLGPGGPLAAAYLVGEGAVGVERSDLPLALNGSVVGLLAGGTGTDVDGGEEAEEEVYVPGRVPPDDATLLGLALIRAVRIDDGAMSLQLVSPLPPAELARVTAVVRNGALELPTPALLDWRDRVPGGGVADDGLAGVRWDDVPFFDATGSAAVGAERRRFRKNLQRKNQHA